jgi:MFS family permease
MVGKVVLFEHRVMPPGPRTDRRSREPTLQPGVRTAAVAVLMLAAFGISLAYGMMLLLPLHVQDLGGDEADFGLVLASAAVTTVMSLVALAVHPEALRPHWVLASAVAAFGFGSAGAALVSGGWEPLVGVGVLLGTAWAVVYTVAPMVMSEMVTDSGRTTYFGYLTGSEQLGIGAGPVLAEFLASTSRRCCG